MLLCLDGDCRRNDLLSSIVTGFPFTDAAIVTLTLQQIGVRFPSGRYLPSLTAHVTAFPLPPESLSELTLLGQYGQIEFYLDTGLQY